MPNATVGNIQVRDVDGSPSRFEGMAIPFGVTINVNYGQERFVRGAFAQAAQEINAGQRIAYLNRHGEDGGVPVGAITQLQERDDGLYFGGTFLDVPEVAQTRSQVLNGIDGVSVEFVPGKSRRRGDVVEYYSGVRLAAIAGSYAPAYRQARVALRSVGRDRKVPNLTASALVERRDAITAQITAIRNVAETEDRALDDGETREVETLTARIANVNTLITEAEAEGQRRDAERRSLPQRPAGSPAIVTRAEAVYGPHTGNSFFGDLVAMHNRDANAAGRMARHRAMVTDLAEQMSRAVDSADLAGAYPTTYMPDLYVPDVAYTGPLAAFFATTPIVSPNPIIIPSFASVTGDTAPQSAENAAVENIDVTTAPLTLTPKTIGGESIVSRQAVDGASPGTDVIIGNQLRELLMRDTEREIALVLEALTVAGTITDTAGTTPAASGRDLYRGIAGKLAEYYAGAAAGGAGARMLPAEGVFTNSKDWSNLTQGEDTQGRALLAYINPVNALGQQSSAPGFQKGIIGGVPIEPAWAILSAINTIIGRRNDARQWKSAVLDVRLLEREGPQSIVFAVWQYFGFAVLEPKGVRRYTYTNV
jgi:HK97 family phage major capsid protein/HK97 family phage prohead protease